MPSLLRSIKITDHKFLIKIFGQCLDEEYGWRILDQDLGSQERGTVDLLAVDQEKKIHLMTICSTNIEEGLIRSFTGYRWFKENRTILKRIFSPQDMDFDLPVKLVLFLEDDIPEASKLAGDICRVPIELYRYICFGPEDDPMVYLEPLDSKIPPGKKGGGPAKAPQKTETEELDKEQIKKRLRIELADLDDREIQEFFNLDLP